jgi:integrase/recombinase XerD
MLVPENLPDLAELLTSWDRTMPALRKSDATRATYAEGIRAFLKWCETTGTAAEITKASAQAFIVDLLNGGAAPATARTRHMALRRFAAWLADEGEIDANPLLGVKPPKMDHKVVHALSDEQLRGLLKACAGKEFIDRRDEALIRLMAETGLRASEAVGLRVADVDLSQGCALVVRGKGGKGRVVPFGPQTVAALDRYLRARRRHPLSDSPALWLGGGGQTFTYAGLSAALKRRAAVAGIEGFHAHRLRHTAATRWLRARGSEQGLMTIAGWSTRSMIDRYTGASASERAADEARSLNLDDM